MEKFKTNLWQTPLWEKFQKKLGRKTWFLTNQKSQLLAVKHPLFLGYNWIDLPHGPIGEIQDYTFLIQKLIQSKADKATVFIRLMPEKQLFKKQLTTNYKLRTAHANHHPETTLKLDLTLSEEEIFKQMKPKGRYNIRLAKKKGVKIIQSEDIQSFFELIQETTQRNQFWGHSKKYYQTMLNVFGKNAQLLLAQYKGEIIAGGIFIYTQDEAIYYYGASGNQYRNLMAPYFIQWKAIQEAKKRKCKQYDFLGISPENSPKNHPWKGVTEFKKKFGGEIISYLPAQEIILKPLLYYCFIYLKKIRDIFK